MRFSAPTLEEAYKNAAKELNCSVVELEIEVIQHPTKGFLGLFAKEAIIKITNLDKLRQDNIPEPENVFERSKKIIPKDSKTIEKEIFEGIKKLLEVSCYDLEVKEVSLKDNNVYIKIDGEDAALMIGVEGYRYKALSYLLHNWIKMKYDLTISLEIAEFLKNQKENIKNYIETIKEKIEEQGRFQTKPLDGILVKIALEELRKLYPDKYVAIKTLRDGRKVVVVNQNRGER